jgi:pimeloyl-ACP methyl ester carboxylesterase
VIEGLLLPAIEARRRESNRPMRLLAGLSVLTMLSAAGEGRPAPLGKLVDLGGYRLHLYCTGHGKQTVVLSAGGGDFSFDWYLVQHAVTAFARVCSYDRPGEAWSDPGPQPRTMQQEAYEVLTALRQSKERGPYVLVGHSLGGLVMRVFAARYPEATAGMVLVDATSPDTTLGFNGKLVHMRELAESRPVPEVQTMKTGPPQALHGDGKPPAPQNSVIRAPYDRLPANIQRLQVWARSRPSHAVQSDDYLPEELNMLYQSEQTRPHPLGDRPLISIIGLRTDPAPADVAKEKWDALMQEKIDQKRDYRKLSTNSQVVEDPIAGHHIQLDDPDTVVGAIRRVLQAAERGAPLWP